MNQVWVNQVWVKKIWLILVFVLGFGSTLIYSVRAAPDNSRSRVPTAKEMKELLPIICADSSINANQRSCTPCPQKLMESPNGFFETLTVTHVQYGRFLSAKETNAMLDVQGCEPHANNFGGTVILRWKDLTKWEFVRYEPGERSSDCHRFAARAGHDVRVCQTYYGGMGYTIEGFGLYDSTRKSLSGDGLFTITSNSGQCDTPTLDEFEIVSVERRDLNRDGRPDLQFRISERHAKTPKADGCAGTFDWSPKKTLTLEFLFDGTKFVPTPATKPLIKYLNGFKA